jgi:small subunit ribosomal protein S11
MMATTTAKSSTTRRKKAKRSIATGQVHILATFNNTIITVTDEQGRVISWSSAGAAGFKGSRKSTPYAAQIATEKAAQAAKSVGLVRVDVVVRGVGSGRDSAIRALQAAGIAVSSIRDVTGVPHNGCRPRKPRRV